MPARGRSNDSLQQSRKQHPRSPQSPSILRHDTSDIHKSRGDGNRRVDANVEERVLFGGWPVDLGEAGDGADGVNPVCDVVR